MIEGKFCEKRNRCCPTGFWLFPTKYATLEQKKKEVENHCALFLS